MTSPYPEEGLWRIRAIAVNFAAMFHRRVTLGLGSLLPLAPPGGLHATNATMEQVTVGASFNPNDIGRPTPASESKDHEV